MSDSDLHYIDAGELEVGYFDRGLPGAPVAILLHGFPYDTHAYDEVSTALTAVGCRVIVPYLRGYGPTAFKDPATLRSGQQGALAHDLLSLMDALELRHAVLAGYDWGGRAACIVSALWPERARGLVTCNGYNIQNIARANRPAPPVDEYRYWYQYYFHSARGAAGLDKNRFDLCKLLWQLWSPHWSFTEETYRQSAASFENPDFVEVVLHSYRHRYGLVAGDARYEDTEARLAEQPKITVPTISIDGLGDGVIPASGSAAHERFFEGPYDYQTIPSVGHNVPQEAPTEFAAAVLSLM